MKIKKPTKKVPITHPEIEQVVKQIEACNQDDLPTLLQQVFPPTASATSTTLASPFTAGGNGAVWKWPRGDLHSWIPVLDRFDSILETAIKDYHLGDAKESEAPTTTDTVEAKVTSPKPGKPSSIFSAQSPLSGNGVEPVPTTAVSSGAPVEPSPKPVLQIQTEDFKPEVKTLILEVLRVERLLLDNSTSRKIFAGYDRLSNLLSTSDIQVLSATLSVLLRPAQQYSSHTAFELSRSDAGKYPEVHKRLLGLSLGWGAWGKLKERGRSMVDLAGPIGSGTGDMEVEGQMTDIAILGENFFDVQIGFYRTSSAAAMRAKGLGETDDSAPRPPQPSELERPTAELRLRESSVAGPSTFSPAHESSSMDIDTPSRPSGSGRSRGLHFGWGRGEDPTSPPPTTPHPAPTASSIAEATRTPKAAVKFSLAEPHNGGIRSSTNLDGLTTISIPSAYIISCMEEKKGPNEVLAFLAETYDIPQAEWFGILGQLRGVMVLAVSGKTMQEERREVIVCRMLALATYFHLTPEDKAQPELFLYEPTIITQLAEVAHPDNKAAVGDRVLAAAFLALDACARYRTKASEVLGALNANVSHGILMTDFRTLVARLGSDDVDLPHELVDALLGFIAFAVTAPGYGNLLVGAGIIPLLVDLIKIPSPARTSYVARGVGLIDSIIYSNATAFGIFCNSGGLDAVNDRIVVEIDRNLALSTDPEAMLETEVFRRTTALKLLLRSIHRMMQSGGTAEGLRSLIDSVLPKSLLRIFENAKVMGPAVLTLAITITATFVHNEPTSLAIIQEMKLHEALYDAVESNEKPSYDVVSAVPNAIGAICLNATGLDYTISRPEILSRLVSICGSEAYREILQERDNAMYLGSTLDELVRHHPTLKPILLQAITVLLQNIKESGQTGFSKDITATSHYKLTMPGQDATADLQNGAVAVSAPTQSGPAEVTADVEMKDVPVPSVVDKRVDVSLDLASKFLQGAFHNASLSRDFLRKDGLKSFVELYGLPALLSQFANTEVAASMCGVIRCLAEANINVVLSEMVGIIHQAIKDASSLWKGLEGRSESVLGKMLEITEPADINEANVRYRQLVYLNNLTGLLTDLYNTVGFAHGRVASSFLQCLGSNASSAFLSDLGSLHRAAVWEKVALRQSSSVYGAAVTGPDTREGGGLEPTMEEQVESVLAPLTDSDARPNLTPSQSADVSTENQSVVKKLPENYASVRYIASQISAFLTPFFQSVIKMLLFRRMDPGHKVHAQPIATQIAGVIMQHLQPDQSGNAALAQAYETTMLGLATLYLFDERSTQGGLQTMLLLSFQKKGGITLVVSTACRFLDRLDELAMAPIVPDDEANSTKPELIRVFGGLKVVLDLIKALVSGRTLLEAPQTGLLIAAGKDKKLGEADYFNPSETLVSLRLAVSLVSQRAWRATWLGSAPLPVTRSAVQTLLSVVQALPDELPAGTALGLQANPAPAPAPFVVNPTHLQTLVDMGFSEYAANHALTRLRNNMNSAAEYLLTHAHLIEAHRAADPPPVVADPAAAQEDAVIPPVPNEEAAPPAEPESMEVEEPASPPIDPVKERQDLIAICAAIKSSIPQRALQLVDSHESLVFDVRSVFLEYDGGLQTIVEGIKTADPSAVSINGSGAPLSSRLRLLAVVATQPTFKVKATDDILHNVLNALLGLPEIKGFQNFKWLAGQLLCAGIIIGCGEDIKDVKLGGSIPEAPESVILGPEFAESRQKFFDLAVSLLKRSDLTREELLANLRLLVLLSRDRRMAAELLQGDTLTDLFASLRNAPAGDASACLSLVSMVVRHAVEDTETLKELMEREIKIWFTRPRSKVVSVNHFVSNIRQVALRDPNVFVDSVEGECSLVTPEPPTGSTFHIQAKATDFAAGAPAVDTTQQEDKSSAMQVDDPFKSITLPDTSGPKDQIMQFLLRQVLGCGQPDFEPGTTIENATKLGQSFAIAVNDEAYNQLFTLLLILTELLGSYIGCKSALLVASRHGQRETSLNIKARPAILGVLLNHFICNLDFDVDVCRGPGHREVPQKRRLNMANWSSSVLVALCADVGSSTSIKDISPELVTVRKVVMDAIAKALKDASTSTDPVSARYGRIWALSDLCYRLLTAKPSIQAKQHDETTVHLAKIMLEKSFVVILTNSLAEVDLNYPNVKTLVAAILQPLEHLTKMSTKMGRATKSKQEDAAMDSDVDMSDDSSDSDDDDEDMSGQNDDSEAPDLYRNSALGMVAGDMEDYMDQSEDEDDEDDEDDPEAFEDGDDIDEQSDGTEPSTDDDEESELEEWENVDDDGMEGDPDDPHYMEGENPMMLGEGDGDEVGEMEDGVDGMMDMGEMGDVDMDGMPLEMDDGVDYDDEDEEGDQDDEDDDGTEIFDEFEATLETGIEALGASGTHAMDSWGWSQSIRSSREGTAASRHPARSRRHAHRLAEEEAEEAMFGHRRGSQIPAPPSLPAHPLLEQELGRDSASARQAQQRRHMPRPGSNINEIMQSIGSMMGPEAMHMLEHLVAQGGPGGEVIRINYDGTDTGAIDIYVGNHHLTIPPRAPEPSVSRATALTESMPQTTMSRWLEEEKMLVGPAASSRLTKLVTNVINRLLPDARQVLEAQKEKMAQEQKEADARLKKEYEERKAREKAEEEAAQAEQEKAALEAATAAAEAATAAPAISTEVDVAMRDVSAADANQNASGSDQAVEGHPVAQEAPAPPVARVTIMIHGAEVDITDTGIDAEFLEALPDDMREDVVNQHMRQQRPAAPQAEQGAASEISPEFLDALPPEIRAEVIQQEAIEAARRAARNRPAPGTAPGAAAGAAGPLALPADIDPVTFLASLDPALRQVVLMEQDEDFLAELPAHLTTGLLDAQQRHRRFSAAEALRPDGLDGVRAPGGGALPVKKPPSRDALQLLDKTGVASLIRLLFFPDIFRKSYLMKVLANLCENAKSRADLISLMLAVLHEGSGDLTIVEKPSAPRGKAINLGTPRSTPRRKAIPETPAASAPSNIFGNLSAESIPTFVAQRCFEALAYITTTNEQALLYFLTEHDQPSVVKKSASKKGKSRERDRESNYPIVTLLTLLERRTLLQVPNMMEALTSLLATLTKSLLALKSASESSTKADGTGNDPAPAIAVAAADPGTTAVVAGSAPEIASVASGSAVADPAIAPMEATDDTKDTVAGLLTSPPQIPAHVLRLVANILSTGECTSRTFSNTLMLIHHLSCIPEARDVISAELRNKAQSLADSVTADLQELTDSIPLQSEDEKEMSLTKFSPASSEQAKLLRILKTIDYMYSSSKSSASAGWDAVAVASLAEGSKTMSTDEELVSGIYDAFHFSPLWTALGKCLTDTEEVPRLAHVATVLLPLVESLMVVSKYSSAKTAADRLNRAGSPMSPMSPKASTVEDLFVQFTNNHRKVLNKMVRNNPSLMSGSFSLLVLNPKILEFDNKRNWFTQQLRKRPMRPVGSIHLNLRRSYIFEDSYQQLLRKSGDALKYGKLNVKFQGEEGVDAGGVTREWYSVLAQKIFDPGYCLFEPCAADQLTYQPSGRSFINPEHLGYFKFVGKVIGKAIYDGRLLDAYFSRAFYKQILGRKVELKDLESVDPEYHKSLVLILEESNLTGVLDLDFSMEVEEFGDKKTIMLKENGDTIPVTEANKEEYVRLVVEHRLDNAIKEQVGAFLEGFYDVIPKKLISIFDPDQLELLISGISVIDVDELKNATQLHGWKNSDAEITWFWRALRSFSQEERARFLMFVTSSSRVPLQGFAHLQGSSGVQPFQIHKLYREDVLPSSATCFNELLLPAYPSYEALRARLLTAITEGSEGFGLA